ncbi:MAG TPA: hypothetical protein VHB18_09840 [Mycobacteriales bacterium]|jgi:hypothetical protein|nr:hypothetical protein [Mycobacteriales bacterium]
MAAARRTAVIGSSVVLASAGLLGTAVAAGHGNGHGHGHGAGAAKLQSTHLTVRATHAKVGKANDFKASIVGKLRSHKDGLAGETVSVEQRTGKGNVWTDAGQSATTDADGKVTFAFVQSDKKEQYRLVFAGDSTYRKSHSGTVTITRTKVKPTPTPSDSQTPAP